MNRQHFAHQLSQCFAIPIKIITNFVSLSHTSQHPNQQQVNNVFTDKWRRYVQSDDKERLYQFQRDWYLKLYGFDSESELARFLHTKKVILDAGCGLGYKSEWLAKLAPHALVIGMDFSDAAQQAAETYQDLSNLFFVQGDIASTFMINDCCDYTSCDQVIMHTEDPEATFTELSRVTLRRGGEFACYFYAKKALPRELLDDYFRTQCTHMSSSDLWDMSEQLTELGRRLSELDVSFECPEIPALGIKSGIIDVQRFIYWNFLKCFWSPELGSETSTVTNYDWYSPSNARRFSENEIMHIVSSNKMTPTYFHSEEACYSGRFIHD
jgi:ubiquinone/menaquinone biosynthesis C-methylase UbiE